MDFKDSQPDHYRQGFQHLLRGLKQQPPGDQPNFTDALDIPTPTIEQPRELVQKEQSFLDNVFMYLDGGDILLLLSQADTSPQLYAHALREQAEQRYGEAITLSNLASEIRSLWNNPITVCKGQFEWRCEFIQKTGKRLLAC